TLAFLNHAVRRQAMVFLLTDFLHSYGDAQRWSSRFSVSPDKLKLELQPRRDVIQELGLTNSRHDLVCLHLHDQRESTLPNAELLTIEDAETGELLEMDSSRAAVRERFARTNAERLAELDRALNRSGVETLRLNTAGPFAQ